MKTHVWTGLTVCLVAFASLLDQIGPFSKDVTDCALMLNAICGHDPMDSTSVNLPTPDFTKYLINDIEGVKIGIPKEYFVEGMDAEVERIVHKAVESLRQCGAVIEEFLCPILNTRLPRIISLPRRRRVRI